MQQVPVLFLLVPSFDFLSDNALGFLYISFLSDRPVLFFFDSFSKYAFRASWFRRVWKQKIKKPCKELKTQNSHWKVTAASPTASRANIQVVPSKKLQVKAILAYERNLEGLNIGFLCSFSRGKFTTFLSLFWCNLYMTTVRITVFTNKMAATGTTTAA